jgi:hypothetical protein
MSLVECYEFQYCNTNVKVTLLAFEYNRYSALDPRDGTASNYCVFNPFNIFLIHFTNFM